MAARVGIFNVRPDTDACDCTRGLYRHRKRVGARSTLRASLSGTFLQTLPDLVTPLKGHSIWNCEQHGFPPSPVPNVSNVSKRSGDQV